MPTLFGADNKVSYRQMLQQHKQPTFILKKDSLLYWHPDDTLAIITNNLDIEIMEPLLDLKYGILQQLQQRAVIKEIEIELDDRNMYQDQFRITMTIESTVQKCKNIYDISAPYTHYIVSLRNTYINPTLKNIFSHILKDGYSDIILADSSKTGVYMGLSSIVSVKSVSSYLENPQHIFYTLENISAVKKPFGQNNTNSVCKDILLTLKSIHHQKYYLEVSALYLPFLLPRMSSSIKPNHVSDYDQKDHYFVRITTEKGTCEFKINESAEIKIYETSVEPDKKTYGENETQQKPILPQRRTQKLSIPTKIMTKKSFFNLFIIGLITGFFGSYALSKLMKCLA